MATDPGEDAVSKRPAEIARELGQALDGCATVEPVDAPMSGVTITPARHDALGLGWVEGGDEITLWTAGGLGGRWELGREEEDVEFFENVVRSIIEAGSSRSALGAGRE